MTHLNPDRESILHEIIARYTSLKVQVAADGVQVAVNCVYVLPSDAVLGIKQGRRLTITKPAAASRERKPIDIFFSALALDLGEYAAGAVLSGGDGDGTLGVKAIKERGGLTLAQTHNGYGPGHPEHAGQRHRHRLRRPGHPGGSDGRQAGRVRARPEPVGWHRG